MDFIQIANQQFSCKSIDFSQLESLQASFIRLSPKNLSWTQNFEEKKIFIPKNYSLQFPFCILEHKHAWSHPGWKRSTDAWHTRVTWGLETWRMSAYSATCLTGNDLHGKTECIVCKLLHVSWQLYRRDWFPAAVCKCITAFCTDFKQCLWWPVSIHHRRRCCSGGTAVQPWVSAGTVLNGVVAVYLLLLFIFHGAFVKLNGPLFSHQLKSITL